MFEKIRSETGKTTHPPNLIPIVRELPADLETPVSVYLKLAGDGPSFLLESVTGGEQVARYSFIGVDLGHAFVLQGQSLKYYGKSGAGEIAVPDGSDPFSSLRDELRRFRLLEVTGQPPFIGGMVGYLGYEVVRYFEPSLKLTSHGSLPDAIFLLADTVIAFDHAYGRLVLIANAFLDGDEQAAREEAESRLDALQERIEAPIPEQTATYDSPDPTEIRSSKTEAEFCSMVESAKDYIAAGDIFQVVLSQRLSRMTNANPFNIYRALRRLNPSPYMFYFDFKDLAGNPPLRLIGASPEMHVRLQGRKATVRPLAGTRHRGKTAEEDVRLEEDLLADPKERAEHVMLVDLARNDLGRVCSYGSVHVPEQMNVERYSHVMHIVSQVEGELQADPDAFDLMNATFPAGTVSGAPKIRAMQIISELEGEPRGPYAGAVGYFSYDGSLDSCITIRTMVMRGQEVSVQAGAGIVADSVPKREYQECINKARALTVAVENAEKGGVSMIAVIDNYDSFTYNLVQYLGELGAQVKVFRNDAISIEELESYNFSHIVISPGPGRPKDAGISIAVIQAFGPIIPILGVCLGHQCIGHIFGGEVVRAPRLFHGKTSAINHDGKGLFRGIPNPFEATRYHSLIVAEPIPKDLKLTASTAYGEVMALEHRTYPIFGVQFHPESILTTHGKQILRNFLEKGREVIPFAIKEVEIAR